MEFPVWHLVLEKITTLNELETSWSLNDGLKAIAILKYKEDIEISVQENKSKLEA